MRRKGNPSSVEFGKLFSLSVRCLSVIVILCVFTLVLLTDSSAQEDLKAVANDANKALRSSQRSMFNGKLDESMTSLNQAAELIEKIKASDSSFSQLKTLESKLAKQKKDLERRMPQSVQPATKTIQTTDAPDKQSSDELPSAVIRRLKDIDKNFENADSLFKSVTTSSRQSELDEVARHVNAAEKNIEQLMKYYGDQIPAGHPELQSRTDRLAALQKQYQQLISGSDAEKAEAAQAKESQLKEARKIGKQLTALYQQHGPKFEGIYGATMVYSGDVEEAGKQYLKIERVEKEVLPVVQPVLATVAVNYGTSAMVVNQKLFKLGMPSSEQFGSAFERLYESVGNVVKSRKASGESIAQTCTNQLSNIDFYPPDIRVKKMEEIKSLLQVGHQFDPNNAGINDMLSTVDQKIDEVAEKIEKDIDQKKWAGNVANFAGPGDAKKLAATALDYFRNHNQWGKNPKAKGIEVLGVAVRGQWGVAETNILGQVIQWRLPIHLAITNAKLKPKNIARIYELSVLTTQGNPGRVEKAPPFDGYWVGNNWMIRLNRLP